MEPKGFDEAAKEAAEDLLEKFWILRDKEPEKYQQIRDREHALRTFFLDKLGLRLIVHRYFAKLEKVPIEPESWMGIQTFQHPRDYALFCCLLAFLEAKNVDEQYLLSELSEELQSLNPEHSMIDWTLYEHRKSLVRVMQFAEETGIVKAIDGDVEGFSYLEQHEVLYEVPVVSRYFMRSYPKDLFQFASVKEILAAEWTNEEHQKALYRRHRVYRRLFFTPALYSHGLDDYDFQYVRQYRNRIRDDIEKHTDYQFELYKNVALLTASERKTKYTLFPDTKAIMDIALQFAQVVREERDKEEIQIQHDGALRLTWLDFEQWVDKCRERYTSGWSKQYREASLAEVSTQLYQLLEEWQMVTTDTETGMISLKAILVRTVGRYPKDYNGEVKEDAHR